MFTIKKILNNSFSKNILQYAFGIGMAQLIAILFQLVLRRIYTKEDFGHYALYTSIVSIITVVSTLRYERAILLPKEDIKAFRLLLTSLLFVILINLLIFFIVISFPHQLANVFNTAADRINLFYLIPISGFLFSSFRVIEFYITRKKAYTQLGMSKVVRRLFEGSSQYLFKNIQKSGLFIGDIIGHFINLLYGLFIIKKDIVKYRKIKPLFKETIIEYADFPKYNLWTALAQDLNTVFLPVLLISHIFGSSITGSYDLARLLLSIPLALITVAVQQVLFQKLSSLVNAGQAISSALYKLSLVLIIIASIGSLFFVLFIDEIILLFGMNWSSSIEIAKILVYSYLIRFILEPFASIYYVLRKLKLLSIWQTIYFVFIVSLFSFEFENIQNFLIYLVVIDTIFYTVHGFLAFYLVHKYQKSISS